MVSVFQAAAKGERGHPGGFQITREKTVRPGEEQSNGDLKSKAVFASKK